MVLQNGREETSIRDSGLVAALRDPYWRTFLRFVAVTMMYAMVPLLVVGWAINTYYSDFSRASMMNEVRDEVNRHYRGIQVFFQELNSKLQLIAHTHSKEYLCDTTNLGQIFELMNRQELTITDLGVIDHNGRHLAYVGPYDLVDKDYSQSHWFRQVMEQGLYISDMFLGFRMEPHFIIAVTASSNGERWVLRATVNTQAFRSLVENVLIGRTGEVYLVNREGVFQTSPRFSHTIMETAPFDIPPRHEGIKTLIYEGESRDGRKGPRQLMSLAWLDAPPWLLVVKQDLAEALDVVSQANRAVLMFLLLSAVTVLAVSAMMGRHLIKTMQQQDRETAELRCQLSRADTLASLGELSAGLAHEMNHPLEISLTIQERLRSSLPDGPDLVPEVRAQLVGSLSQIEVQLQCCQRITTNLLRFSRRTRPVLEKVYLNRFIMEVIELVEREAWASGVAFFADLEEGLPTIVSDPSQLQQIFLDLFTNAVNAHDGKGYGSVTIQTRSDDEARARGHAIMVRISDTGQGLVKEQPPQDFEPLDATRPNGRRTGLGLSISAIAIKQLGGTLSITSCPGEGTDFAIYFPLSPPPELLEQMARDALSRDKLTC